MQLENFGNKGEYKKLLMALTVVPAAIFYTGVKVWLCSYSSTCMFQLKQVQYMLVFLVVVLWVGRDFGYIP